MVASVFSGLSGAKTDMSIAHLSRHTTPQRRTLAVSAANVQIKLLTFLGMICFTPLDALLRVLLPASSFGLLRYRLEISLCMFGCGFGVIVLVLARDKLSYNASSSSAADADPVDMAVDGSPGRARKGSIDDEPADPLERGSCCRDGSASNSPSPIPPEDDDVAAGGTTRKPRAPSCAACAPLLRRASPVFALTLVALFFTRAISDMLFIIWPLFIKHHFGWEEREYGLILPINQALGFTLVAAPWLSERLGTSRAVALLGGVAFSAYLIAFTLRADTAPVRTLHVACVLLAGVSNGALEVVLTALASTFAPPDAQGRLFATVAIMRYAGSISGNLGGTSLYQYSLGMGGGPTALTGGALPISVFASLALLNIMPLSVCVAARSNDPPGNSPGREHGVGGLIAARKGKQRLTEDDEDDDDE
jgi:hypothetical protein